MKLINKIKWWFSDIYYEIKGWWKGYTRIHPRYLGYSWEDKDNLITHLVFECFCQFIEEEADYIDWYSESWPQTIIIVNGKEVRVRDEMQYLYDWWIAYNTTEEERIDKLYEEIDLPHPFDWNNISQESKDKMDFAYKEEEKLEEQLKENLIRVINIKDYMWS